MPGLNGSVRVLDPQPGIIPGPSVLGAQSLSHWTTREVPDDSYFIDEEMKVQRPEQWTVIKRRLLGKTRLCFSCAPSLLSHFTSNTTCVGVSHVRQFSATPAKYATIHFQHDSELVQTPLVQGSTPPVPPPTSDTNHE